MTLYRIGPDGQLQRADTPRRDTRRGRHHDPGRSFRSTAEYRRWREAVLRRSNVCELCGQEGTTANPLTAGHVLSARDYPELRTAVENGRVECRRCNLERGARNG